MARRNEYYDFYTSKEPKWKAVAFPDGDSAQIPIDTGIYRFVCRYVGDNQTLFADIAPSTYGPSLQACYNKHVSICDNQFADLYELYITGSLEFEHFKCTEKLAKKHKHFLVTNFKPHFNFIIEFQVSTKPNSKPFDN